MRYRWISLSVTVFVLLAGAMSSCGIISKRDNAATVSNCYTKTVILDAGHGGEDGGAVAPDGTKEKDINLEISRAVAMYLDWFGIPYKIVRQDDTLIGDNTLKTVRERKASDLHLRMELVNKTPDAILLSIHQNYFISERFSGTQVFYSPVAAGSAELAEWIQRDITAALQPDNTRKIKPTEGTVYLLDKAEKTSVMVECGFLSNRTESDKLKEKTYQSQLAFFIVRGVCDYFNDSL